MTQTATRAPYLSRLLHATLAAFCLLGSLQPSAAAQNLFNTQEFPVAQTQSLPRWEDLLERYNNQKNTLDACATNRAACPTEDMQDWHDVIVANKDKPKQEILANINRFINRWPYKTDWQVWGMSDYWATPLEFTGRSGDCEDYSIFKYITLQYLGFEIKDLRLVVVQDTVRNIPHAILAVYLADEIMILDSLFNRPLPHSQVIQYTPYYSVNETTRWAHLKKR